METRWWISLLSIVLLSSTQLQGQYYYEIKFKDKLGSEYSVDQPEAFLSPQAIKRRSRFNIPITQNDLPVSRQYVNSILSEEILLVSSSKWLNSIVIKSNKNDLNPNYFDKEFIKSVEQIVNANAIYNKQNKWEDNEVISSARIMDQSLDYGFAEKQIDIMEGDFLHRAGFKGESIPIAVLDAGFTNVNTINAFNHLWNENRLLGWWNFVEDDDSVFTKHSHGTSVLSTMAADQPGSMVGTAPEASYWLLRSEYAPTETIIEEYYWAEAAEYADSVGAMIINSSLGYTTFDDSTQNHTYADMDGNTTVITKAADIAASKGILVVNSAGNSGNHAWRYIGAPADGDSVLAVGGVQLNGDHATLSSHGPSYDGRVKPDVCAVAVSTTVMTTGGTVAYSNGTSFASPAVAGLAACLWQAFPEKSNMEILQAIQESAHIYHSPDDLYGYGIPNFKQAYFNLAGISITDANKDELIKVFPSPFKSEFSFIFYSSKDQNINISVHDMAGKKVFENELGVNTGQILNKTVHLTGINDGIYFLTVRTANTKLSERIVHVH